MRTRLAARLACGGVPWAAGCGGMQVVAGLLAQLLAERGQDPGARWPGAAVDQGAAAGALGPAELVVNSAAQQRQFLCHPACLNARLTQTIAHNYDRDHHAAAPRRDRGSRASGTRRAVGKRALVGPLGVPSSLSRQLLMVRGASLGANVQLQRALAGPVELSNNPV